MSRLAGWLIGFGLATLLNATNGHAFLGTELAPLIQLVQGQVAELEKLSENIGLARDNQTFLLNLNEGIQKTVSQIQSVQSIVERAQGLNPNEIRSLSDINSLLTRTKDLQLEVETLLQLKVTLADQAISRSALQTDTTYRMGQEMVVVGGQLSSESESASPGRSSQISAAATSAQMLSSGVQLQALAQIVQLQALSLEFQKMQAERELKSGELRHEVVRRELAKSRSGLPKSKGAQ